MGRNLAKMARKQRERTAAAVHKKDVVRRESGVKNRRHGPLPALPEDLRSRTISVRLNPRELEELDRQRVKFDPTNVLKRPTERSRYQRGEWLRMSFLGVRPDVLIPVSNQRIYAATARTAANLTQISAALALDDRLQADIMETKKPLAKFRISLILAKALDPKEAADRVISASNRIEKRARRGRVLPEGELRDHVVAVRLTGAELLELDKQRGYWKALRGEWMRMAWVDLQPNAVIPAVTNRALGPLVKSATHLNSIALYLNRRGDVLIQHARIGEELAAFRAALQKAEESKE